MLQWLKIADLVVDEVYQRELKQGNWKAIRAIAENFVWSRFSPVFVAPIEGGRYAIIDGQHRTHAALMRGHDSVPCQIVQMSREEQAAAFAAVNGLVTKVTVWQIYKAALAAGEDWAADAAAVASEAGCRLMTQNASSFTKKPGEIYGINSFRAVLKRRDRAAVVAALKLLMKAEGYRDAQEIWDTKLLLPIIEALAQRPHVLEHRDMVDALERWDVWAVIDEINVETRERIRKGLPHQPKKERLAERTLEWLDSRFKTRVALPGAR